MKDITIYGAGGHGFAAVALILSSGEYHPTVVLDDEPKHEAILGVTVQRMVHGLISDKAVCISIGANDIRKRKVLEIKGHDFPTFIHQSAVTYPSATIGRGSMVLPNAVIDAAATVGEFCIINNNATVSHNCEIGDFCHIAINVALAGGVTIGEGTLVGAGSVILPEITVGKWVTIGAGSIVTKDIPEGAVVIGNPARIIKKINTHE